MKDAYVEGRSLLVETERYVADYIQSNIHKYKISHRLSKMKFMTKNFIY